jgi:penicillin-binding protein 1A
VTLHEMVASYSTIANEGRYTEPVLVTQVEDKDGAVLERFDAKPAETALSAGAALTLLDVLRGVIDRGTGVAIRTRFGIRADVAGKTGTTQDNTDGWFVLMHPQLVAGAWVGFNDNRITMRDHWGQGARSALPMVGDFFQQSLKTKLIDAAVRFPAPPAQATPAASPGAVDPLGQSNGWVNGMPPANGQPGVDGPTEPATAVAPGDTGAPAWPQGQPEPVAPTAIAPQGLPLPPGVSRSPPANAPQVFTVPRPRGAGERAEGGPRIFTLPPGVLPPAGGALPTEPMESSTRQATGRADGGLESPPVPAQGNARAFESAEPPR